MYQPLVTSCNSQPPSSHLNQWPRYGSALPEPAPALPSLCTSFTIVRDITWGSRSSVPQLMIAWRFNGGLMGFSGDFMGLSGDFMGFSGDFMGLSGDFMGFFMIIQWWFHWIPPTPRMLRDGRYLLTLTHRFGCHKGFSHDSIRDECY